MTSPNPTIAQVVARIKAQDPDRGADAQGSLEWLAGDEGPEVIAQSRLQEFLWYRLPTRWLMTNAEHHAVVDALAEALDLLGLHRYAAICRSATTAAVLDAYEEATARGKAAFRKAFDASGIDPPNLPGFSWGPVMGPHEAHAHDGAAGLLEMAVAAGDLVPGRRGWQTRRAELVRGHLTAPRPEWEGDSHLDRIQDERLADWLDRKRRAPAWRPLLDALEADWRRPVVMPPDIDDPIPPLRWLLGRLATGQALTETGNLNRAFVQEASHLFGWWDPGQMGLPQWEDYLPALRLTHDLAVRLKAVRRSGKNLTLSPKGRSLLADADALWRAAAWDLIPEHDFSAAAGQAALAVLATGSTVREQILDARVQEIIAQEGWHDRRTGIPADARAVGTARHATTNMLRALNLTQGWGPWADRTLRLTPAGLAVALEALRHRATGPLPNLSG